MTRPILGLLVAWLVFAWPVAGRAATNVAPQDGRLSTFQVCDGRSRDGFSTTFDEASCRPSDLAGADPQGRLIWVRAWIDIPADAPNRVAPTALYVTGLAASEAFVNGVRVGGSGNPGAFPAAEAPGRIDSMFFVPPGLLQPGRNLVAVKLSSFHSPLRVNRALHLLALGSYGGGRGEFNPLVLPLVACGVLLAASFYFAAFWLSRRNDRASLFLALASASAVFQFAAEHVRDWWSYPYPLHVPRLILVIVFAACFGVLMTAYLAERYAKDHQGKAVLFAVAASVLLPFLVPSFDPKTGAVLAFTGGTALVVTLIGVRRHVAGARIAALAVTAFLVGLVTLQAGFLDTSLFLAAALSGIILFGEHVVHLRRQEREAAEARIRSARLELELLKRQLQPHFLMNTLTSLSEWIESDPKVGLKMLEALADEFRALLRVANETLIPISEEVALCEGHLRLMSLQRDARYSLHSELSHPSAGAPPTLFQTLIENALTHRHYDGPVEFVLRQQEAGPGQLAYELSCPPGRIRPHAGSGAGLAYVRARLTEAYGEAWTLDSGAVADGRWITRIVAPGP